MRDWLADNTPDTRRGGDPNLSNQQRLESIDGNRRESDAYQIPEDWRPPPPPPEPDWTDEDTLRETGRQSVTKEIEEIEAELDAAAHEDYFAPIDCADFVGL